MTSRNVIRSYLAITGVYTLSASLIWGVLIALRRLGGRADVIRGRAALQGPCAADGLPDVAYVDTTRRQAAETTA